MARDEALVLGIETSCDETSAALVRGGRELLSCVISSQVEVHRRFGGVVPEIASRRHVEAVIPVIEQALERAGIGLAQTGAVAVTSGPGLVGALLVGLSAAKGIAYSIGAPLVCVNHIEGHIYANFLAHPGLEPPILCLTVSGGHTQLIAMRAHGAYETLGRTRDDAAGETFDKVARVMGLPYPGGPELEKLAREGDPEAIPFTLPQVHGSPFDFSFSGLKTAVINYLHSGVQRGEDVNLADVAAGFQRAAISHLVSKIVPAVAMTGMRTLAVSGGVSANAALRSALNDLASKHGINVVFPPLELCTDNAAMIASAGYYRLIRGDVSSLSANAVPGAKLGSPQGNAEPRS
ncbi:MAG: tRNA (adenosine(37)-N6)-threonylcarbamoyltransferase complex transferase subunit TsaD [Clostridia bacterium]|nr:tRNA (adenosine(37)-N6)-threonylcarbamoyltransferase complex transferase subunit TsaD [Clostridia bacterium]